MDVDMLLLFFASQVQVVQRRQQQQQQQQQQASRQLVGVRVFLGSIGRKFQRNLVIRAIASLVTKSAFPVNMQLRRRPARINARNVQFVKKQKSFLALCASLV